MISLTKARKLGRAAELHTLYLIFFISSFVIHLAIAAGGKNAPTPADFEDNEFAEFEEFDDDVSDTKSKPPLTSDQSGDTKTKKSDDSEEAAPPTKEQKLGSKLSQEKYEDDQEEYDEDHEGIVDEEPSDEETSTDDEEFEGKDRKSRGPSTGAKPPLQQTLKITDVPAHLVNNWTNFQLEMAILAILAAYLLNYIYGKTKNHSLATTWFETHRELLESNFHIVGDDGTQQEPTTGVLMKESDSSYSLWCTGRQGCSGMLVQLKLLKRQDIVSLVMQLFRPKYDRVMIRVNLNNDEMDTFVCAIGQKKSLAKLTKEMMDLSTFCTEKKNADKVGLPSNFTIYSEIAEVTPLLLDGKVISTATKYAEYFDYIHVSDQYSGVKPQEGDAQTKLPDTSKVLIFSFNVPGKLSASEREINEMRNLMSFVLYMVEKIRRLRLSREAKQKADKNRQSAAETFLKTTHAQRQELAQQRREEKIRERKERVLAEEDPDKQRRLEKQELKREKKKNQPKVKQLKIKAG